MVSNSRNMGCALFGYDGQQFAYMVRDSQNTYRVICNPVYSERHRKVVEKPMRAVALLRLERFEFLVELKHWYYVTFNIWNDADTTVRDLILQYVKPGMRCVDIGAHRGRMTDIMLKAGADSVRAFEPLPDLYWKLHKKYLNTNVQVWNDAVSDEDGSDAFYRTENPLMSSLKPEPQYDIDSAFSVVTHRLDWYAFWDIHFIKIDVEGFEMEVLRGAEETINKYHPIIVAECLPSSNNLKPMLDFFHSHGYETVVYANDILAVMP